MNQSKKTLIEEFEKAIDKENLRGATFEGVADWWLSKILQVLKDVAGEEAANQNVSEYYSGYNAKRREILDIIKEWES